MRVPEHMIVKQEMTGHVDVAWSGTVEISMTCGNGGLIVLAVDHAEYDSRDKPKLLFNGAYDSVRQAVRRFHDTVETYGAEIA